MPKKYSKAYALLLINACLWGFASPIAKSAYNYITPELYLFGRFLFASLLFLPIYLIYLHKKDFSPSSRPLRLIMLGLFSTPLTLYPLYEGLKYTSAFEASILVATGPIFTILAGHYILKESLPCQEKLGIFISLLGTLLIVLKPLIIDGQSLKLSLTGNLLITASNLIWTAFVILQRRYPVNDSRFSLTSYLISVPFFLALVLMNTPAAKVLPNLLQLPSLWNILYIAIFGSVIAFWAHVKGQNVLPASDAAVFSYLQPVFAFPLAFFWLHEPLSPITVLAIIIIIFGVYLSESSKHYTCDIISKQ